MKHLKITEYGHKSDMQGLAIIDRIIESLKESPNEELNLEFSPRISSHSPAQAEIIRQVIHATGDFDYQKLIYFSDEVLEKGAAAIAARTSIIVDVATLQMAISPTLQSTFANGSYACANVITRPQTQKTLSAWGMETLALRYPSGIYVVGESYTALQTLVNLITSKTITPALIIATPPEFTNNAKSRLQDADVPCILINGQKGGVMVAAKILTALVALAWEVYGTEESF
jgi:precorrin-8X/cobalt-precorrin-8 methylmutase